MKSFLLLTSLTALSIPLIAYPAYSIIYADLRTVLEWSYSDSRMAGLWWNKWHSWVVGPVGRYAVGVGWSYWGYRKGVVKVPGARQPSLYYLILLVIGFILTAVSAVSPCSLLIFVNEVAKYKLSITPPQGLAISTTLMLHRGETTVELQRRKAYTKLLNQLPKSEREGFRIEDVRDEKLRRRFERVRPDIRLFIPNQAGELGGEKKVREGQVMIVEGTTWTGHLTGMTERKTLLRRVWESELFPDYRHCQTWDNQRIEEIVRLQGYI